MWTLCAKVSISHHKWNTFLLDRSKLLTCIIKYYLLGVFFFVCDQIPVKRPAKCFWYLHLLAFMLELCQVFSPELMNTVGYSLLAVSASSRSKYRIWINLSAVRTCFHSGTSKAIVERVYRWCVFLSTWQVKLLEAAIRLLRYLLCSQENEFVLLAKLNLNMALVCNKFTISFLIS